MEKKIEEFSAGVIARNEELSLPRLDASLKGVEDKWLLDTGSTDNTVKIAKELGWNVVEVGDMFRQEVTQKDYDDFVKMTGLEPTFKVGEKFFHFANARNHLLKFPKHDWVFQADADEEVTWDLQKVKEILPYEDHLVYRFCFAHKPDGTCGIEFTHCKFFRKSKLRWRGFVHEVEGAIEGIEAKPPRYVDFIYHHHWQNPKTERTNYLPGLELAILEPLNLDRNLYYLGREYFWKGEHKKSLRIFEIALEKMWWAPERGQAYIWMGLIYKYKKDYKKAIECFHKSFQECDTRREPWFELANVYEETNQIDKAIMYYSAAMSIPFTPQGYMNSMDLYGSNIPDRLAFAYHRLGDNEKAKKTWAESIKYPDVCPRILSNIKHFYDCEKISIIVPTCRPDGFKRLEDSIRKHTMYPNYEIIKKDGDGTAIEKFNAGVKEASGELIVFIADDCEVRPGWLENAYVDYKERFGWKGLVIFNDDHWHGIMANHFLCSKNLKEELGGEIWHSGYFHNGVDVELYARLKEKNLIHFCEEARIIHHHYFANSAGESKDPKDKWHELVDSHCLHDRLLLPERMWKLGLKKDAYTYADWLLGASGYTNVDPRIDLRRRFEKMDILYQGLNVLNLGIGEGLSAMAVQLRYFFWKQLAHLETHKPYIDKDKQTKYNSETVLYYNCDLKDFREWEGHHVILAFDILEHLGKEDTLEVIREMKESGSKILIFIPLEKEFRENTFEAEAQEHKSLWTEQEFKDLGFQTELLPNFHKDSDALWAWI